MRRTWHLRANLLVALWLMATAGAAIAHRWLPSEQWLMVHLLMLGGVSVAMLIWSAHFTEALRRRSLPGGRRGQAARLAGHTVASLAVIAGVLAPAPWLVTAGAAVLIAVAVWHAITIAVAARAALSNRLGWSTWGFVGAAAALALGVVGGVLLSRGTADADGAARLYLAHVTLMILGWVAVTVMTTLLTLWPTVLAVRVPVRTRGHGQAGLLLMGAGVLGSVLALFVASQPLYAIGVALVAAGIAWAGLPMVLAWRERPPHTVAALHLAAAVTWLLASTTVWVLFVARSPSFEDAQQRLGGVVAALVAGGAAQVLLGSLSHLMPMILGGGPHAVRTARDTVERGALARWVLINGGVALWVLPLPSLVRVVGSVLALVGGIWLMAAIARALVASRRASRDADVPASAAVPVALSERPRLHGTRGAMVAAAALLLGAAGAVIADPAASGVGAAAAADAEPTGQTVVVQVRALDMRFDQSEIEVEPGDRLIIALENADSVAHDLVLDTGDSSGRLAPGETASIDLGVVGRDIDGWCSIAGHRQMGMTLAIRTGAEQPAGERSDGDGPGDATRASAADDVDLKGRATAAPYDAVLAPAPEETVHRVELEILDAEVEVAPGATQRLWTFGGSVPAPTLRGKVGDTFEVTLVNHGDMAHSIDFHASQIAPDQAMRSIEPGESLTYRFVAHHAGAWLYHCSTAPMSLHIANGMYGAVIIDPPDLAEVDREFVVVQQEMYLGEQAGTADAAAIAQEQPDLVVFNGHATQYVQQPLEAVVGERVRFWVVDAGPSRATSWHVVGEQFDTVYAEGAYLVGGPGTARSGGAQALALQPGQGGFVELTVEAPGTYPFVSHVMVDAERGAKGLLEVRPQDAR